MYAVVPTFVTFRRLKILNVSQNSQLIVSVKRNGVKAEVEVRTSQTKSVRATFGSRLNHRTEIRGRADGA